MLEAATIDVAAARMAEERRRPIAKVALQCAQRTHSVGQPSMLERCDRALAIALPAQAPLARAVGHSVQTLVGVEATSKHACARKVSACGNVFPRQFGVLLPKNTMTAVFESIGQIVERLRGR